MRTKDRVKRRGFTLIELAIVLVIIGLILGMVFKGRQLIDSAKVDNVIAQKNKILAAVNTFYERYGFYPGDGCTTSTPASPYDCTGTKNGVVDSTTENNAFWYLLINVTHLLSQADRDSVFGQPWNIYYKDGGDWLDLPGGAQIPTKLMCAIDKKIDDGEYNTGHVQATVPYHKNTDCWSLSGNTDGWIYLFP
ncbi:MAG: prepilin-type N-terminal cleavage/methylation domain-containing protein [Thermodesulfobacteria bacterium]|nr:prepilin-type N-terminal cleavage/methylation domain-containing protein [Thermodesulfobacteriota bacterium]